MVPAAVQIDDKHVHDAVLPLVVHVSFVGHATGLSHWPAAEHVCSSLPEHCVEPAVQATHEPFRQTGVAPTHASELSW
jgi:hypothetical protein